MRDIKDVALELCLVRDIKKFGIKFYDTEKELDEKIKELEVEFAELAVIGLIYHLD